MRRRKSPTARVDKAESLGDSGPKGEPVFASLSIPLPGLREQRQVVACLDETFAQLDAIAEVVTQLSRLLAGPASPEIRADFARGKVLSSVFSKLENAADGSSTPNGDESRKSGVVGRCEEKVNENADPRRRGK